MKVRITLEVESPSEDELRALMDACALTDYMCDRLKEWKLSYSSSSVKVLLNEDL